MLDTERAAALPEPGELAAGLAVLSSGHPENTELLLTNRNARLGMVLLDAVRAVRQVKGQM